MLSSLLVVAALLIAPGVVVPAEDAPLALVGATVVTRPGAEPIENATVIVRNGRIEAVGVELDLPYDARAVDATGLTLTPGFVDALRQSELEFPEHADEQGRPADTGRDVLVGMPEANRRGVSPDRQAWRAMVRGATEGEAHRKAGYGALIVAPSGMLLAGTGAAVSLTDRPVREALGALDLAQFGDLSWRARDSSGNAYPGTLMGVMAHLRQALMDASRRMEMAERHAAGRTRTGPAPDAVLIALEPVLRGEIPLVIEARAEEDIRLAVGLLDESMGTFADMRLVIAGGREAWEVRDLLAARDIGVVLDLDFGDEPEDPDDKDGGKKKAKSPDSSRAGSRGRGGMGGRWGGMGGMGAAEDDAAEEEDESEDEDEDEDEDPEDDESDDGDGPWNPGVPTRVKRDLHARWVEDVAGVQALFDAGVRVAFGTFDRKPGDLLGDVRVAMEKGGLTADNALLGLTGGGRDIFGARLPSGRLESGAAALVAGWKGDLFGEKTKVRLMVVDGVLFDFRDRAELDADPSKSDEGSEDAGDSESDDEVIVAEADAPADPEATGTEAEPTPDVVAAPPVEWPVELDEDRIPDLHTGGDVLIRGATIHTASHGTLDDADMLVRDGKIVALGERLQAPDGVAVVDAAGLHVIPGVIDCHSHAGIRGGINESTRTITAEVTIEDEVDPDDVNLYRALAGGVTSIRQLHGSANVIGGRHAVVKLRWGASAPEMLLEGAPAGVKFALGENPKRSNWGTGNRFPGTRMGVEASLRRAFEAAERYDEEWARYEAAVAQGGDPDPPRWDIRLEALSGILAGDIGVHSHAYRADEMLMLMSVAEEYGFRVATLQHVLEGYKIAAEIAAHGGLGGSTFVDWWAYKAEANEATPYAAALMHEGGVLMSVNSDSDEHLRRLYLEAAKTVKYGGMDEEAALCTVTLNPAIQLGIDEFVGSLDVGKDADFAVFSHHPFDTRTRCVMTFVDGECMFQRSEDTYDAWIAEVGRRVAEARKAEEASRLAETSESAAGTNGHGTNGHAAEPTTRELLATRNRQVDPAAVEVLDLPRDGTKAPSTPDRADAPALAVVGGRVHTMEPDGDGLVVYDPGVVTLRHGRITGVYPGTDVPGGFEQLDVSGLDVWPGLVDANTTVGLEGIGSVGGMMDTRERGGRQPDLRASTAWHPASEHIPVARVNGITTALVTPRGGALAGQSSFMALEGWTVADALVKDAVALHVSAPRVDRDTDTVEVAHWDESEHDHRCMELAGSGAEQPTLTRLLDLAAGDDKLVERIDEAWAELRDDLADAREYARVSLAASQHGEPGPAFDPRLAALAPYALGTAPVVFQADRAEAIADALAFAESEGLDAIISGGREAWKVADLLALADVPVLLGPTLSMPSHSWDPYDAPYSNAAVLEAAGVRFAFTSSSSSGARNLPYQAAMAVAYGLDEQVALAAITSRPARILGLADEVGTLAPGRRADLLVTAGSPLQITARVAHVIIGGRPVALESKHTQLYERYRSRLHDPAQASR